MRGTRIGRRSRCVGPGRWRSGIRSLPRVEMRGFGNSSRTGPIASIWVCEPGDPGFLAQVLLPATGPGQQKRGRARRKVRRAAGQEAEQRRRIGQLVRRSGRYRWRQTRSRVRRPPAGRPWPSFPVPKV